MKSLSATLVSKFNRDRSIFNENEVDKTIWVETEDANPNSLSKQMFEEKFSISAGWPGIVCGVKF